MKTWIIPPIVIPLGLMIAVVMVSLMRALG